ncbi:MAG: pyridoxal-phosphate dependent enzyme [Gammaproteobacteria bacterium]
MTLPSVSDVHAAAGRIAPWVRRTPVLTCSGLDEAVGGRLFFKCENFQKTGAFKARGAVNAVFSLEPEEAARGVATHSSGNHGAALAMAAARRGIPAWVVVPADAPPFKRANVARYGATVVDCAPGLSNREAALAEVAEGTGATVIHPYDDARVIAGQGTAAVELMEQVPGLDLLLAPVGGGGLISGCALAARAAGLRVVAAEPAGADDAWQSFQTGGRVRLETTSTIADGLRASLGERNWALMQDHVEGVCRVEDGEIIAAMRTVWERMKIAIEPSAAVPVAALLSGRLPVRGLSVGVILSGGNLDLDGLPGLFAAGRPDGPQAPPPMT